MLMKKLKHGPLFIFMFCSHGRLFKRALNQDRAVKRAYAVYMQRLICFFRSACKLISQWICSQNQPIRQPALLSNAIRRRLKSQYFCGCIARLRITLMSGLLLLVTERALLMSPKGRNASRNGLGWYTHYCFLAYSF